MSRRTERLNVLFRQELSDLIWAELRDPRLTGIVSLTRAEVSPDLENCTVFVSVLGDDESKTSSLRALSAAAPFLRRHLIDRIRIRRVPHLHFVLDETIEEAARILDLMKKVSRNDTTP